MDQITQLGTSQKEANAASRYCENQLHGITKYPGQHTALPRVPYNVGFEMRDDIILTDGGQWFHCCLYEKPFSLLELLGVEGSGRDR